MKKVKGTHYASIPKSNYPKLDELETQIKARNDRLDALIAQLKKKLPKS